MTWDLAKARARIGLTAGDTARDDDLQAGMDIALAACETYCDRNFLRQEDTQEFTVSGTHFGPTLLVRRYPLAGLVGLSPLDASVSINPVPPPEPVPPNWRMDKKRGIIFMVGAPTFMLPGNVLHPAGMLSGARGFILTYVGGYDPLPADLEAALWMVFDNVWGTTPGLGVTAGAGTVSDAPIKSFGIDGMSIQYDTSSGAKSGSTEALGILPASAIGILGSYRSESAALGG